MDFLLIISILLVVGFVNVAKGAGFNIQDVNEIELEAELSEYSKLVLDTPTGNNMTLQQLERPWCKILEEFKLI